MVQPTQIRARGDLLQGGADPPECKSLSESGPPRPCKANPPRLRRRWWYAVEAQRLRRGERGLGGRCVGKRQGEPEGTSLPNCALGPHLPPVLLDDGLADV